VTNPPNIDAVIAELSEAQRRFVVRSTETPMHPFDIDATGRTAIALVRKGIALRSECRLRIMQSLTFTGYALTPLGLAVRSALIGEVGRDG
jgi:hypothetical protein